jgi:hypothetical protein
MLKYNITNLSGKLDTIAKKTERLAGRQLRDP